MKKFYILISEIGFEMIFFSVWWICAIFFSKSYFLAQMDAFYLFVEMHSNKDPVFQASIGAKELDFMLNLKVFPLSIFPDKRLYYIKRELHTTGKILKN